MRASSVSTATRVAATGNGIAVKKPFAYTVLDELVLANVSQVAVQTGPVALSTGSTNPPAGQTSYVHTTGNGYPGGSRVVLRDGGAWDFTGCFFRMQVRCQLYGFTQGYYIRFATSKAAHDAGNLLEIKFAPGNAAPNWLVPATWVWDSFDPLLMTSYGTGASLSSVGYITFASQDASSAQTCDWDFARIQRVQKTGTKAKCVIWHDDSVATGFAAIKTKLDAYGWGGSEANEWGSIDAGSTFMQTADLVAAKAAGWSIGTHATTNAEHVAVTAAQFANQALRNKTLAPKFGLAADATDFAYWGGLGSDIAYPTVQRLYRSGRWNTSQLTQPETQPPGDPAMMKAFLVDQSQTFATNWKPILQNAITTTGLAQFVFHQQIGSDATQASEFDAMLAWLDTQRANIDVVSISQAIAPLLVGYVPDVVVAPTTLTIAATAGNGQIVIRKSGGISPGAAVTYKLYRGTTATGTPISTTFPFTDAGLTNGTSVSYIATATNSAGTTASTVISATPTLPAVTRADDFNRADSTTSLGTASDSATAADAGVWTILAGTWGITGNQAFNASGASGGMAVRDIGTANHSVQTKYGLSGSNSAIVIARCTDVNNWYGLLAGPSSMQMYKRVAGTVTAIGTSMTSIPGDVIKLTSSGTSITTTRNGTDVQTITDTGLTTGSKVGMRADSKFGFFDDFLATAM